MNNVYKPKCWKCSAEVSPEYVKLHPKRGTCAKCYLIHEKAHDRASKEVRDSLTNRDKYPWPRLVSDYKWSEKRQTYIYYYRKPSTIIQCLLASKN